jgi:hypothetical protein
MEKCSRVCVFWWYFHKWNKIDKQEYKNNVEAKITTLQEINQPIAKRNIDKVVNELCDILYSCTEQQRIDVDSEKCLFR